MAPGPATGSRMPEDASLKSTSVPSYGSAGREAEKYAPDSLEWVTWGSPLNLLLTAGKSLLRQVVALGLIIFSVFTSSEYLMSCDSRKVGMTAAVFCEYTKAYVRCFPLLALVIAMMVSTRQILQHRVYYKLLRHGALLDIENFSPLSDPLFLMMLASAVQAIAHFVINICHAHSLNLTKLQIIGDKQFLAEAQETMAFYVIPTGLFVSYLWFAYDTEGELLPLSKYMEADPEYARKTIQGMPFLREDATAAAVDELCPAGQPSPLMPEDAGEAYSMLIERSLAKANADPDSIPRLSRWRLVSTMWPAEFLLNSSRADEESLSFRRTWYAFSGLVLGVMVLIFFYFISTTIEKINDVRDGQLSDIAGVIVGFLHLLVSVWLVVAILKNITIPWRTGGAAKYVRNAIGKLRWWKTEVES